jgi:dihydropyrimidinase
VTEQRFDLVVRNGTIVTPGRREQADVGITGGRIAQLGGTMTGAGEIDASGLLVIPGGIDAHVHLLCAQFTAQMAAAEPGEPVWADDFWTGSLAAIAGGITTIGNMTFALPGESMTQAVARDMAGARAEAAVDWFLHPVLTGLGDAELAEVAALAADGHTSIKVFLSNPGFAAGTPGLAEVVAAAGRAGSITLAHCEDAHLLERTGRALIEAGRGTVRHFPGARTVKAEVAAVESAVGLAAGTGSAVYIVHLSSAAALARCRQARAAGLPIFVETRPLYLHLTRSRFTEPDAAKYVGAPPLREQADRDALWRGLAAGDIDTLCSDHAPWTLCLGLVGHLLSWRSWRVKRERGGFTLRTRHATLGVTACRRRYAPPGLHEGIRSGLHEGRINDDPPPRDFRGVNCLNRSPHRPRAHRCGASRGHRDSGYRGQSDGGQPRQPISA